MARELSFLTNNHLLISYLLVISYIALRYVFLPEISDVHLSRTLIENMRIDCGPVLNGTTDYKKYKYWTFDYSWVESELYAAEDICSIIPKFFHFEKEPLSAEEANFPLAYGLVTYKDVVQVLMQLSIFYHPQNQYCITIDKAATMQFKRAMASLPRCFGNIATFVGTTSNWGTFGILENVYNCFHYLSLSDTKWEYYQYLSGSDLPLRTNLEMVRVFKALNGSINTDVEDFEVDRYKNMEGITPPVPLYKSSMSVSVPRAAATFMIQSRTVKKLLKYLSNTWVPDESFWTSVAGNQQTFDVPGSFRASDVMWLRKHFSMKPITEFSVNHIGTSYIGRYQVWSWQKPCGGKITSWSCVYGVEDMKEVVKRPELVAHKIYLDFEPAAFMCLFKEIRQRSYAPSTFSAQSYSEMPTVELHNGKSITELTHPEWLLRSSFAREN